ncbi:MAG: DNA-binding protein [Sphingomonadaceae bacterium]
MESNAVDETTVKETRVMILPDGRVSRADAAKYLGRKAKTLADWHRLGKGPRSRMVGGRRFYMIDDLSIFARGEVA